MEKRSILRKIWDAQWISFKGMRIVHRWDASKRQFVIGSEAGVLTVKPKTERELTVFRDKYINTLEQLGRLQSSGQDVSKLVFGLYVKIRREYRTYYSGNLRTRLRGLRKCTFSI